VGNNISDSLASEEDASHVEGRMWHPAECPSASTASWPTQARGENLKLASGSHIGVAAASYWLIGGRPSSSSIDRTIELVE
jgi:hypothetical protein